MASLMSAIGGGASTTAALPDTSIATAGNAQTGRLQLVEKENEADGNVTLTIGTLAPRRMAMIFCGVWSRMSRWKPSLPSVFQPLIACVASLCCDGESSEPN